MAREIMLSDGRTALFDDDASDAEIERKLKDQKLTRATSPVAPSSSESPSFARSVMQEAAGPAAAAASFFNSMTLGIPEMAARAMGAGPTIEDIRLSYPGYTTAGDVAGLLNPARLGMKATEKAIGYGMSALRGGAERQAIKEAEQQAIMRALKNTSEPNMAAQQTAQAAQIMPRQPTLRDMAGRAAQRTAEIGGGVMGAQVGAAALGGAREPGQYGAGAQQGAQVFRQAAMSAPGTQLVPGLQTTIGAVTSPIPAAIGYGSLAGAYAMQDDISRRIREEAARRALQGQ